MPPRLSGGGNISWLPQSCGEAGERSETEEDCCLIIRKKLFNKDNINYKTSILYRHSAVASCHFPRLLGKARPYYLIVPLFNHRFREMFRRASLAQHDTLSVIPGFLFYCHSERNLGISWKRLLIFWFASARCFDRLNMTKNFNVSAVNRLIRRLLLIVAIIRRNKRYRVLIIFLITLSLRKSVPLP